MELTVTLGDFQFYLSVTADTCTCAGFYTCDVIIAIFGKVNILITGYDFTVVNSTFNTGDMNNGTFTEKVLNISLVALKKLVYFNLINYITKVVICQQHILLISQKCMKYF